MQFLPKTKARYLVVLLAVAIRNGCLIRRFKFSNSLTATVLYCLLGTVFLIMNVKKEVLENLKTYFQKELKAMDYEIWKNKNEIKKLVEKQELLKRSRAKLDKLSRELS